MAAMLKSTAGLLVLALLATVPAEAVESFRHRELASISARRWDPVDIQFGARESPDNPVDVRFDATFSNAAGETIDVPGFYDADGRYVIRFTPRGTGRWNYVTTSEHDELDGRRGQVDVAPARTGRKGGIVVDPKANTRFRYENGDSYFPIAFESDWLFALDADNAEDIPRTRKFVDQVAAAGFDQIVMNVFAYDVNWQKDSQLKPEHEFGSPDVFPFFGTNDTPQHSQLNIEYFQRLDRVVDYLDQQGIVAHLMIYVWNKRVNWPEANSKADNRYFDYVVKRYQAFPNIVWDISKEALGYGHTDVHYISDRIERLRGLDCYNRLVTVHDYSYCRRFPDRLDFISVQLWSSELYGVMRNVRATMPGKPVLNIEHGGYERGPYVVFTGNYTSAEVCLERAYQCVFAGTFPTHYWQGAAWNVIIPDPQSLPREDRPRLEYYRHMRTLIDRFNIDQLIAGEKKSNAGFSLHNGKDLYLYYVPKECEFIGLRLPKELQGQTMKGTWFNPFTGDFGHEKTQRIEKWPAFKKPDGEGFRILVVEIEPE